MVVIEHDGLSNITLIHSLSEQLVVRKASFVIEHDGLSHCT